MNPTWSRYAARLKNTRAVRDAIMADGLMLGRVTRAMLDAESLDTVRDEEVRQILQRAAAEVAGTDIAGGQARDIDRATGG